jgi:acetylglutamate kinase
MDDAIRKAETLIEARSYIRMFRDKLTVIKLGGSAMEDADALKATLQDVIFMETVGLRPVLVHGGGKPIDRAMARAGLQPRKIQGRRYTDEATLAIVVKVLLYEINEGIVRAIRQLGGRAVGLHSGSLQSLFSERLRLPGAGGESIDLGFVGRVTKVEGSLIESFCAGGVVPVIPSVAVDIGTSDVGQASSLPKPGRLEACPTENWLNVNADTAAAAVAAHLRAEKLVFLTDTPGILLDRGRADSLLPSLNAARCRELIERRVIAEGMIPKVEACLDSVRAGVRKTHVIDGRLPHSLLLEIYTDRGVGTEITLD